VSLRATATANGLFDQDRLQTADPELREYIETLQTFLFHLAEVI